MSYREALPVPALRSVVAAYWCMDGASRPAADDLVRVLPDGCADLICDFSGASPTARWIGTMTRAIVVPTGPALHLFGIRFAPGGLYPLLGAPLWLLTDRSADLSDLPAAGWQPPLAAWHEEDFAARCARADASVMAAMGSLPCAGMARLLRALEAMPALPAPGELAGITGFGTRTLQRRFVEQLGVSPRQHLRFLRFERARRLLERGRWRAADVAATVGYSDQAHFVREFRRFAGVTPGRWR